MVHRAPRVFAFTLPALVLSTILGISAPADTSVPPLAAPGVPDAVARLSLNETFGRLPLQFEVNRGQVNEKVRFLSRAGGYQLFLTDDEAVFSFLKRDRTPEQSDRCDAPSRRLRRSRHENEKVTHSVVRMRLEGANPKPRFEPLERLPGNVNYFIGNDPKKWRTDVPTYKKVALKNVYKGVDLVYYGNQRQFEYDFVVKPGADPNVIRMSFSGADELATDGRGDLRLTTAAGTMTLKRPSVYQEIGGRHVEVPGSYVIEGELVAFHVDAYDRRQALVIDPAIVWATFLGGSTHEDVKGVGTDGTGAVFVFGDTWSIDFPTTPGSFSPAPPYGSGSEDGFVAKLNATGTSLLWGTYIGAPGDSDYMLGMAVDGGGAVYLTGHAESGWPTTPNAYRTTYYPVFITKIAPGGNALAYSTFIGGEQWDEGRAITLIGGDAVITGVTINTQFPTTNGALQDASYAESYDAGFVTRLSANGRSLVASTILGGKLTTNMPFLETEPYGIAADGGGNVYVTGNTNVLDFPISPGAYQSAIVNGYRDAFVTKLNPSFTGIVYSTFVGGDETETGNAIAPDSAGNTYVGGNEESNGIWSTINFPTTPGAFLEKSPEPTAGFVLKLSPDGRNLLYSTLIGKADAVGKVSSLVLSAAGNAVIAGTASGDQFPVTPGSPSQPRWVGYEEAYVAELSPDGTRLLFCAEVAGLATVTFPSTFGVAAALGPSGDVYVTGSTNEPDFPITPGAFQPTLRGTADPFVFRMRVPLPITAAGIAPPTGPSLGGTPVTITGTGFQSGATVAIGGSPASVSSVTSTQILATTGPHAAATVDVVVTNPDSGVGVLKNAFTYTCSGTAPTATLTGTATICSGQSTNLSVALTGTGPFTLVWSDGITQSGLAGPTATRSVSPAATTTYTLVAVADSVCTGNGSGSAVVTVNPTPTATITAPSAICMGSANNASVPDAGAGATYTWTPTNVSITSGAGTRTVSFGAIAPGPASLSVTVSKGGCSANSTANMTAYTPPTAAVSGGGTICSGGGTATIQAALTGIAPWSIRWTDGVVQTTSSNPATRSVSPASTTTYGVTLVSDGSTCSTAGSTGSATVTVNPTPSAAITSAAAVCSASAGNSASVALASGGTYNWSIANGTITAGVGTNAITYSAGAAGTVTLGVTVTAAGCSASSTRNVTIAPPPTATVSGGGTICAGRPATISAALTGTAPWSLTWSDGFVQSAAASPATRSVSPASSTTYTVTALSDAGCTGSASGSAAVTVNALPTAAVAGTKATICPGDSTTISAVLGGTAPISIQWSDGTTQSGLPAGTVSRTVKPTSSTAYTIRSVTDANCTGTGSGTAQVVVAPDPSMVAITAPAGTCANATGLTASIPPASAGSTITWTIANGTITAGAGTNAITFDAGPSGPITLNVTLRLASGCSIAGTRNVTVTQAPARPEISAPAAAQTEQAGLVASVAAHAGNAYAWTIENGTITAGAGTNQVTFTAGYPGTTTLSVYETNPQGCRSEVATFSVTVGGILTTRVVPVVLDTAGAGGAHFTTELTLANPGPVPASVGFGYTAASALSASGSGSAEETIAAGRELVIRDTIAYLRGKGLPIPASGGQGGSLSVTFRNVPLGSAANVLARTTTPSGAGSAGLAYGSVLPEGGNESVHLFGLRQTAADRSNIALENTGTSGPVTLRVTLRSGQPGTAAPVVLPDVTLGPGQWTQLNAVLAPFGIANGWARVDRVAGTDPFLAYAVFNDNATSDGSFVPPVPVTRPAGDQLLPVLVETGVFTSELVLTNPGTKPVQALLSFSESLAHPNGWVGGSVTETLQPGEQRIVSDALQYLRSRGASFGARGPAYAGALLVQFTNGGAPAAGFVGARTAAPAPGGGQYGLYVTGLLPSEMAATQAWVFGLVQDASARSNLAFANGAFSKGPVTLKYEVFDGDTGAKAGESEPFTLGAGTWRQENGVLAKYGVSHGYVRVTKTSGTPGFVTYGVVNDGATTTAGTSDGSYVPMSLVP